MGMSNPFKCDKCGEVFNSTWTDGNALEEMRSDFGDLSKEERAIVCDDCYKEIKEEGV